MPRKYPLFHPGNKTEAPPLTRSQRAFLKKNGVDLRKHPIVVGIRCNGRHFYTRQPSPSLNGQIFHTKISFVSLGLTQDRAAQLARAWMAGGERQKAFMFGPEA